MKNFTILSFFMVCTFTTYFKKHKMLGFKTRNIIYKMRTLFREVFLNINCFTALYVTLLSSKVYVKWVCWHLQYINYQSHLNNIIKKKKTNRKIKEKSHFLPCISSFVLKNIRHSFIFQTKGNTMHSKTNIYISKYKYALNSLSGLSTFNN